MKTRYRLFSCRTPVRQLPYVSNVLILSYWKSPQRVLFFRGAGQCIRAERSSASCLVHRSNLQNIVTKRCRGTRVKAKWADSRTLLQEKRVPTWSSQIRQYNKNGKQHDSVMLLPVFHNSRVWGRHSPTKIPWGKVVKGEIWTHGRILLFRSLNTLKKQTYF